MKEIPKLTRPEAIELIAKKLKLKLVDATNTGAYVRKVSSLERIVDLLSGDPLWQSKYPNNGHRVQEVSHHYFLDIWVGDDLLTFRCDKK